MGSDPDDGQRGSSTSDDDESNDRRIIYFIVGGIFLAFAIGFVFLVVALVIDWN